MKMSSSKGWVAPVHNGIPLHKHNLQRPNETCFWLEQLQGCPQEGACVHVSCLAVEHSLFLQMELWHVALRPKPLIAK